MTPEDRYHFEPLLLSVESAIARGESVGQYHHSEVLRLLRAALPVATAGPDREAAVEAALAAEPEWPYDQGLGNQPTVEQAFEAGVGAARHLVRAALRGAAAQADGREPGLTGIWTPDGPVTPDVIDYTRPILERAMAAGRTTATVSGIRWTFTAPARLTDPNP